MIDDLSDAYIDVYDDSCKNDWGYLCNNEGSAYSYLQKKILIYFPSLKITFFVPYLAHAVININSKLPFKKYALGDREKYTDFLKYLVSQGHEIAHHGSDHGKYIEENKSTTVNNWIHEWALFKNISTGIKTTLEGVVKFKEICNIDIVGGKYCGYVSIDNSQEIIDKSKFLYWCEKVNYTVDDFKEKIFGENEIISFPTNISGNIFVRLSYLTGNQKKDKIKKTLKYFQNIVNINNFYKLIKLYKNGYIISIQEHISPSTSSGLVQSANIISDTKSLFKILSFLKPLSVYYGTCEDISKYIYVREKSTLKIELNKLILNFENLKNIQNTRVSITCKTKFTLKSGKKIFKSNYNNNRYVANIPIVSGKNIFKINS